jgi:hypothetical protein
MMTHCRDCKHWGYDKATTTEGAPEGYRECALASVGRDKKGKLLRHERSLVMPMLTDGDEGFLFTAPEFGCVNVDPR